MNTTIRKTFTLPVGPRKAFDLLTDARLIRSWSGQRGGVQPRIGGRFSMFDGWVNGVVLAYSRGSTLAYTWRPTDWKKSSESSIVVYTFRKVAAGTRVSLTHKDLPTATVARDHASGWNEHVVAPLKSYIRDRGI